MSTQLTTEYRVLMQDGSIKTVAAPERIAGRGLEQCAQTLSAAGIDTKQVAVVQGAYRWHAVLPPKAAEAFAAAGLEMDADLPIDPAYLIV